MSTQPNRSAFTLVELLVAMAIIGILIALLLPAVQSAREAARRMTCRNNVKQIALAMHNYHDAHRMFPLNYGGLPYDERNTGASWMQMILPYVDQQPLYNQIRFGQPLSHADNRRVAETVVPVYVCPSDTHSGRMDDRDSVPGEWAVTNYKACLGSNWEVGDHSPVATSAGRNAGNPEGLDHCTGLICRNGAADPRKVPHITTRMRDVTDGTSTSIAIGESVPEWCRHTWWWWFNGTTATTAIPLNYKTEPDTQVMPAGDWMNNYSFMSRHEGGANFGMTDGSVRFISETIDLKVYRALGSIQGAEIASAF